MFGTSPEKKVAREVDRIVSMKEDVDALSWGRVLEIGKLLRERADDELLAEYARELVTIAQSNLSLANRLGIDTASSMAPVMASGMNIVEGGYAEAALQDEESVQPSGSDRDEVERARLNESATSADEAPRERAQTEAPLDTASCEERPDAPAAPVSTGAPRFDLPVIKLPGDFGDAARPSMASAAADDRPAAASADELANAVSESVGTDASPGLVDTDASAILVSTGESIISVETGESLVLTSMNESLSSVKSSTASSRPAEVAAYEPDTTIPIEAVDLRVPHKPVEIAESKPVTSNVVAAEPSESAVLAEHSIPVEFFAPEKPGQSVMPTIPTETKVPATTEAPQSTQSEVQDTTSVQQDEAKKYGRPLTKERVARFRNLYESQDGGLCVFEDEHGHLVAVDATKLV